MCGISGYSHGLGFGVDSFALRASIEALAHRGPDDSGVLEDVEHGIGLGHTRLSILDLSSLGHQPMTSEDKRVALVFNGEIYNFREVRTELELEGHVFRGHSDTEVLLRLYLACRSKGDDFSTALRRLNGIFAFALWDAERGALLLARDAFGVKPLYYSLLDGCLAFASEIKALFALSPALGVIDYASIDRYLTFLWCPGEGTPLKAVRKLGPGEALWVRDGRIEKHLVWYTLPQFRVRPFMLSETEAIKGTFQHLRRAVQRQLIADVPVGAFLSGGLDSSSVVAFAREFNPDIRCFTIASEGGTDKGVVDDLPYAIRVAKYLQVPLEVVTVDSAKMAQDLVAMVVQLDEPLADAAALNVLYICKLAREHGVKVLLSGSGGDDLFSGYRRHRALMIEPYWNWLPKSVRLGLERLLQGFDQRTPFGRRLIKAFSGCSLDSEGRLINYFRWIRRSDLAALYSAEFRAALSDSAAERPMIDFLADLPPSVEPLERMLALEQRFFLTDHNLVYSDKMSMAVGVELRVPFLDLDLVEFAYSIPSNLKQRGTVSKWILKKAMEPLLPQDIIHRPKSGFGVPIRRWMRLELRDMLDDILSERSLRHRGIFDPAAVQRLIADNDSGKKDAGYTLHSLLCIETWCREFLDKSPRSPATLRGALDRKPK